MEETIKTLVTVIRQEEKFLARFLELLNRQKKALVENDLPDFEEVAARQEELIENIRELENRRVEIVRSVAGEMNREESEVTLTRLVEMSLGTVSAELADAKKNLNGLVGRIKKANQVNQYLVKRSLNRTQRNIDWLIDGAELEVTYRPDGRLRNRETRSVIVNKTL